VAPTPKPTESTAAPARERPRVADAKTPTPTESVSPELQTPSEPGPPAGPGPRAEPAAAQPTSASEPAAASEPTTAAGPTAASEPTTSAGPTAASEPTTSAGPAPQSPAPAAPESDLGLLLTRWKEIVDSVRPATRAVITECRPMAVEDNIVTLGFPEAKAFLKDVAERKRPDLEAAVGGFLGRAVTVRCVATNVDIVPHEADKDADFVLSEARRIFADDLVDVGEVS
jgi:hypothetical protein